MAQRVYKVRLQAKQDLDLINLLKNYNISSRPFFKECLINYVQNNKFTYDIPEHIKNIESKNVEIQLYFDENIESEAKVIKLLDNIKAGYLSIFIKNIVRSYIKIPIALNLVFDPEIIKELLPDNDGSNKKNGFYPPSKSKKGRNIQEEISKHEDFEKKTGIYALNASKIKTNEENSSKVIEENNDNSTSTEEANSIRMAEEANSISIEKETNSICIEEKANSIRIVEPIEENNNEDPIFYLNLMETLCS